MLNIFGVAQPTLVGLRTILTLLQCGPSDPNSADYGQTGTVVTILHLLRYRYNGCSYVILITM